jgi:hypothetical protein
VKIGRNDPCPCGSGKKYKKCCGSEQETDFSLPEELRTGTPLDDYMRLVQAVALYAQSLIQFHEDGRELKKAGDYFEKEFLPGTPFGVPDSLYMSWLHYDLRFGKAEVTVCERFLDLAAMRKLNEPGPTLLRSMRDSYTAFYQVCTVDDNWIVFEELGTSKTWHVHRVNEPEEVKTAKGDVWYVRLIGPQSDAYIFSAPYVFPSGSKSDFTSAMKKQIQAFAETAKKDIPEAELFRESCKASVPFWARYFIEGEAHEEDAIVREIRNTDNEPIRFCKLFFVINVRQGLEERLSSIRAFEYDERSRTWTWVKRGNKMVSALDTTALGTLSIKRKHLVAETNSEERAFLLIKKLKRALKEYVSFEKMDVRNLGSLSSIAEEEGRKIE